MDWQTKIMTQVLYSILNNFMWISSCVYLLRYYFSRGCISMYYCWFFYAISDWLCHSLKVSVLVVILCITARFAIVALLCHSLNVSVLIVFLCITVGCFVQYLLWSATVSKFQTWLYFCVLLLVVWCNVCFSLPLSWSFSSDCISVYYCWLFSAIFALLCLCLEVSVLIVFLCITAGCLMQCLLCSATVLKFQFWLYFCVLLLVVWCNICFALPLSPVSVLVLFRLLPLLYGAIIALLCHSLKVSVLVVFLCITAGCLVQYSLCSATVSQFQSWLYFCVLLLVAWCNICFALPQSQSFSHDCISVYYCWLFGAIFALLCHSLIVSVMIVFLCITVSCLVQYLLCSAAISQFQSCLYFCLLLLVAWCNICFAPSHLKVSVLIVFLCIIVGCLVQNLLGSATVTKFQSWLYFCVLLLVVWCNICFALPLSQRFNASCISV